MSFDQFQQLANYYNKNVTTYTRQWSTKYAGLYHDIWMDQRQEIAISLKYDSMALLHRLYIHPNKKVSVPLYTRQTYHMPIERVWHVESGGPHEFLNEQFMQPSMRYSYKLNMLKEGSTFVKDGMDNEDYYAFGKPVVAPANGKVLFIENNVCENKPFFANKEQPFGNYIIIDHGHHEYSLLAYLKMHSIQVNVGEMVHAQQNIAQCGNSGDCLQPQLLFQVMNRSTLENCTSMRINFVNGIEPIQGNMIRPFIQK